jgi:hypothetical protein
MTDACEDVCKSPLIRIAPIQGDSHRADRRVGRPSFSPTSGETNSNFADAVDFARIVVFEEPLLSCSRYSNGDH